MERAEQIFYEKIIRRGATWKEIRTEIVKDFMFLSEVQRNVLADCWDKLTKTQEFQIRKMNKDRSNDPRIYTSVYEYREKQFVNQIERDKKRLQKYVNGKPVDWKPRYLREEELSDSQSNTY